MRPRALARGNLPPRRQWSIVVTRFNEAASARSRKPDARRLLEAGNRASMRPRALARGEPSSLPGLRTHGRACFNEAASARSRKLRQNAAYARDSLASMRPRALARGNVVHLAGKIRTAPLSLQ